MKDKSKSTVILNRDEISTVKVVSVGFSLALYAFVLLQTAVLSLNTLTTLIP